MRWKSSIDSLLNYMLNSTTICVQIEDKELIYRRNFLWVCIVKDKGLLCLSSFLMINCSSLYFIRYRPSALWVSLGNWSLLIQWYNHFLVRQLKVDWVIGHLYPRYNSCLATRIVSVPEELVRTILRFPSLFVLPVPGTVYSWEGCHTGCIMEPWQAKSTYS